MKQTILSRNRNYSARVQLLLDSLSSYSEEQLNKKPADGGWSPIQILHHLAMSEELSLAYTRKKMGFSSDFEENNLAARVRSLLLRISLHLPVRYAAPPAIDTDKLPAFATFAETRAKWEQARAAWTQFFEQMPDALANKLVYKHPRAGRVTWLQMLSFFNTHMERHRKQIYRQGL